MKHTLTIAPSAAVIVDADGQAFELPKARSATYRVRCTCGWRGSERSTEGLARTDGAAHVRLMERKP